jgi:hypothetical protein
VSVKRALIAAVVALVLASPLYAQINPRDQGYAVRFSLKINDLGSGWRSTRPKSTTVRRSTCPSAPRVESAITGFADSARFRSIDGPPQFAATTTRAFSTVQAAKTWYNWSGGGELAKCTQATVAKIHADDGWKVSDLRRRRESMPLLACDQGCPPYVLRAWRISQRLETPGEQTTYYADVVTVRIQHVVINLMFESYDIPFTAPEIFVTNVLLN